MANSLRAKLSKLRHDGHITDAEYQAFIKKMDGHDREIRNKVIDELQEAICDSLDEKSIVAHFGEGIKADIVTLDCVVDIVFEIAEKMRGATCKI